MKLAFVQIPKTGGASVYRWWYTNLKDTNFQFIRNDHLFLDSIDDDYETSFTITRNTFNRLISLYIFQKIKCEQKIRKNYKVDHYNKLLEVWNKGIIYYINYSLDNNFNGTTSQLEYIKGVEHVFATENLSKDFKKIQQWANCNIPLEKNVHVGQYNKKDFMTTEYIDFVGNNFQDEIEYFAYQPIL